MRKQKGFSLIELLIVVAIILIIAAIAVPNLLKSKMAANEASAAASLRTIGTGNVTYSSTYNIGFAGTLGQLGPPTSPTAASSANADLIDLVLAGGTTGGNATSATKSGYNFTYGTVNAVPATATPNGTYTVLAHPVSAGATGTSWFCVDQTNVVLKDPNFTAAPTDATLGCVGFTGPPL